ncbi:MAG: fibronectin type III domain-containing protein [Candidatus Edwardsbacteria bacterium]|nr:fibronectin type III domain-containing protein [Candidatus Edwardsbacteria bacterium]
MIRPSRFPVLLVLLALAGAALAAPPVASPGRFTAFDTPDDDGTSITLEWQLSPADTGTFLDGYAVYRAQGGRDSFEQISLAPRGNSVYHDNMVDTKVDYYYRVAAVARNGQASQPAEAGPLRAREQWFKGGKVNALIGTVLFVFLALLFIDRARKGKRFIRHIPGLDAVEEAVGRATEMGRPILYVLGLSTISDVATIAGLNILGNVAKKTAEYETPLMVPTNDYIVHTVATEVVKQAYASIGRPDLFNRDSVFYLTSDQMGYAAGVSGLIARDRPATNLFMGMFFAESLVMAEAGAATGAIQIAGTDAINQLPFFVTACDYTLMAEEFYAASAYLSQDPLLVGGVKGQDFMKLVIVALVGLGSLWALIFRSNFVGNLFSIK